MGFIGISSDSVTNLVQRNLPNIVFSVGTSISITLNFEQQPQATLTFEAVRESEISQYRNTYKKIDKEIELFEDLILKITSYSESHTSYFGGGISETNLYDVTVSLNGFYSDLLNKSYKIAQSPNNSIKDKKLYLNQLASICNISYSGFNDYIEIENLDSNTEVNFNSVLNEYKLINDSFIDYNSNIIKTKAISHGKTIFIPKNNILYSVESTVGRPPDFDNYEVDFTPKSEKEGEEPVGNSNDDSKEGEFSPKQLVQKPLSEITLIEGDLNPNVAPKGLDIISGQSETNSVNYAYNVQDLSLNFDLSGPRKTKRTITTVNGQPHKERIESWGFAYFAIDIENPEAYDPEKAAYVPPLLGKSPTFEGFWTKIEDITTEYIYKPIDVELGLRITEEQEDGSLKRLPIWYLNEKNRYSDSSPNSFSTHKYLTSVLERGWKLGRFLTEEINLEGDIDTTTDTRVLWHEVLSKPSDDPNIDPTERSYAQLTWSALQFRKFTVYKQKIYRLDNPTKYYTDEITIPYKTEKVKLKQIIKSDPTFKYDLEKDVIVAIPDPNFVYPLLVLQEEELTQGIHTHPNPRNVFIKEIRKEIQESNDSQADKIAALKENPLLPELIVGEDSYSKTYRKIQPSSTTKKDTVGINKDIDYEWYSEYSSSGTSQDNDFRSSFSQVQFKQSLGRPPAPSTLSFIYESPEETKKTNNRKGIKYTLNKINKDQQKLEAVNPDSNTPSNLSSANQDITSEEVSQSIRTGARTKEEAFKHVVNTYKIQDWLNTTEVRFGLAYYYPKLRPGDYVVLADNNYKDTYRIKSVSYTLNCTGSIDGSLIITCDGTNIACGIWDYNTNKKPTDTSKNSEENSEDKNLKDPETGLEMKEEPKEEAEPEKKLNIDLSVEIKEFEQKTADFKPYSRRNR